MLTIDTRNVHRAIPEAAHLMQEIGFKRDSRNGPVLVLPRPLTTTYRKPLERVEFYADRDSNPFFHLMESIWMLAGRNDVKFVGRFSRNIKSFSDDGKTFNGAYGFRWREWFEIDQLSNIIIGLHTNPDCRRQVLTMWDGYQDLTNRDTKDVPCNTQAYFQISTEGRLDMMVCNRSNDLVWGAYGANAVHFSVLLEYMASCLGVRVGRYYQTSMNTHVYERHWDLVTKLAGEDPQFCPYSAGFVEPTPLMDPDMGAWHRDLARFFSNDPVGFETDVFLNLDVVLQAHTHFKDKKNPHRYDEAREILCELPPKSDWRAACSMWLNRRQERAALR